MTNWLQYPVINNFGVYPDPEGAYPKPDINIMAPAGTAFDAPASGTVTGLDRTSSYGQVITIQFDSPPNSTALYYAFNHLSSIAGGLSIGSHVNSGDILGYGGGGQSTSGADPGFAFSASPVYGQGLGWAQNVVGTWINPLLDPTSFLSQIQTSGVSTSQSSSGLSNPINLYSFLGLPSQQQLVSYTEQLGLIIVGGLVVLVGVLVLFLSTDAGKKALQSGEASMT